MTLDHPRSLPAGGEIAWRVVHRAPWGPIVGRQPVFAMYALVIGQVWQAGCAGAEHARQIAAYLR
ncbi:hypothetical protein EZM97_15355 [Dyella soli]|uniref:Uncharacterized protein n=1 Tax=Dyella soli TaxID=522319 RepID=A0A4R0YXN6_9GAMM|nr:hypothetical protein EZM97_15355 [Dyella soli]